jgi:hypothetical protein
MNIYTIILIGIQLVGFGIILAKHGQKREGEHNAGIAFVAVCITIFLVIMSSIG